MSDKKNQHYIPQFCLRKFASDSNKVINLYNLDSKKFIKNASIKHQACKNYFYGKDIAIENALAYFEDGVSKIFNKILRDSKLPQKKSEDYLMLLFFISIQHNRTKFAHDDMMGIHHQIMSILGKNFNHLSTLSENNWIYEKMSIAVKCISYLKDLKMKLIVNKTTNEFTYSDNPIVFYNQFLEMKGRSEIGCNSVGIEILLPISPFLYLILYDAQIYHIGKSQSDTIETYDNDDIDNLNRLQILSANSNIYFSKDSTQQYIEKIAENKSNYRRKNMSTVTEYHSVTNKYKSLIGIHAIPIVPRFPVLQIILYSPLFPKWGTLFFGVLTPFFSSFFSRCSPFSSSVFPKIFKTGNAIFRVLTPFSGICSPVPRVPQNFYTHIEKKKCVQFYICADL